jgi:hypothetical protein
MHKKNYLISLLPGMFYCFVVLSYIFHAPIGFGIEGRLGLDPNSYMVSYIAAAICSVLYAWGTVKVGGSKIEKIAPTLNQ